LFIQYALIKMKIQPAQYPFKWRNLGYFKRGNTFFWERYEGKGFIFKTNSFL